MAPDQQHQITLAPPLMAAAERHPEISSARASGTFNGQHSKRTISDGKKASLLQRRANQYVSRQRLPLQMQLVQLKTSEADLSEVDADLREAARAVLGRDSGKRLAAECQADGRPVLKIRKSTRPGYPATGANYNSQTNTILISQEAYDGGRERVEGLIRWELQNAESSATFDAIAASVPSHGSDFGQAVHMVYHYEKTEYRGLVRNFHDAKKEGVPFPWAESFEAGRSARWSSFFKYFSEQVQKQHYIDKWRALGKGVPMLQEFEHLLTPEDYEEHDWSRSEAEKYRYVPPAGGVPLGTKESASLISFDDEMNRKAADARKTGKIDDIMDLYDRSLTSGPTTAASSMPMAGFSRSMRPSAVAGGAALRPPGTDPFADLLSGSMPARTTVGRTTGGVALPPPTAEPSPKPDPFASLLDGMLPSRKKEDGTGGV
ncbi:MAG: hypothetical protein AAF206_04755 [Bacteroidota bacterium]